MYKLPIHYKKDAFILDTGDICLGNEFVECKTKESLVRFLMSNTDSLKFDTAKVNEIIEECDPEILLEDWPHEVAVFAYVGDSEICVTGKLRHESCYSVNSMAFFNNWKELTCDFGGDTKHLTFFLEADNEI